MQNEKKPNSTTTESQSAVDFLINQWLYLDTEFEMRLMDKNTYWQKLRKIQAQSKEMFEKQIIEAKQAQYHGTPEQYYNDTFKK